jgi:serine/threonine protein kinase
MRALGGRFGPLRGGVDTYWLCRLYAQRPRFRTRVTTVLPGEFAPFAGMVLDQRYRLERLVGAGASSTVFAAEDMRLDRQVAIKILRDTPGRENDARRERFADEARTLAKLCHPHIVAIHDARETPEGVAFLVMELASQGTLESELRAREQLAATELIPLLLPVMGALACAHDRGIVHCDLKPANLVFGAASDHERCAKVLDFGIAARSDVERISRVAGTPAYMAPEQVLAGEIGPHTDVWAMGTVLFQALSGRLPFDGPTRTDLLFKIVHERAPRLASMSSAVGAHLALAIDRALEPDRELRYRDMRELARALAIACRLEGIRLPVAPDPLGLPCFGAWLAEADMRTTTELSAADSPQSLGASLRARSRTIQNARGALGWMLPFGSALLIVAVAVVFMSVLRSGPGSRSVGEGHGANPPARDQQRGAGQFPVALATSAAESSPSTLTVNSREGAQTLTHRSPQPSARRRRHLPALPMAETKPDIGSGSPHGSAAAEAPLAPNGVITRWDW